MQTDTTKNAPGDLRAWVWTADGFERTEGVPAADRGFRYGMSIFESFPVRDGMGIFLERHLARLKAACGVTGLAAPQAALEGCEALL